MFPFLQLIPVILQSLLAVYFEPVFWVIILLVGWQYRQVELRQYAMFGACSSPYWLQTLWSLYYGTIGGIIGSLLAAFVGISLNELGIKYIWPLAVALMLINIRFVCFAYAGGLIALSNVLIGWPQVNVPQVLGLVAVLHLTESVLIYISTQHSAVPVYVERENRQIVGGLSLQNYWPLPLILLAAVKIGGAQTGGIAMPDWWPLIPTGSVPITEQEWMYVMLPVVAALGYSDLAIANTPETRRRISAGGLAIYSGLLLGLAVLSVHYTWVQWIAALLSPLGHELVARLGMRAENNEMPLYVHPYGGVRILATVYGSPAQLAGVKTGDLVVGVGAISVRCPEDLGIALQGVGDSTYLTVNRNGELLRMKVDMDYSQQLGIILAPVPGTVCVMEINSRGYGLWDWFKVVWQRWVANRKKL